MTDKERMVLQTIQGRDGCGANLIASVLWPDTRRHMSLRAGQYVGKLITKGWVRRTMDEYTGVRGNRIYCGTSYSLTKEGRTALRNANGL